MRLRIIVMLVGAVLVVATFTFPMWQPYLQSGGVSAPQDVFPGLAPQLQTSFLSLPQEQQQAYQALAQQDRDKAVAMVTAALAPVAALSADDQALPQMNAPVTIAGGTFQQIDAVRYGQGTVNIFQQADNSLLMRFEDLRMLNGPDLRVYLSAADAPKTGDDLKTNNIDPLEVGTLKTPLGSQNYDLPGDTDVHQYRSVVIYSPQIEMVYTYAPLFVRQ